MHGNNAVIASGSGPKRIPKRIVEVRVKNVTDANRVAVLRDPEAVVVVAGPADTGHLGVGHAFGRHACGGADEVAAAAVPVDRRLCSTNLDPCGGMRGGAARDGDGKVCVVACGRVVHDVKLMAVKSGRGASFNAHTGAGRIAVGRGEADRGRGGADADASGVGELFFPSADGAVGLSQDIQAVKGLHDADRVGALNRLARAAGIVFGDRRLALAPKRGAAATSQHDVFVGVVVVLRSEDSGGIQSAGVAVADLWAVVGNDRAGGRCRRATTDGIGERVGVRDGDDEIAVVFGLRGATDVHLVARGETVGRCGDGGRGRGAGD